MNYQNQTINSDELLELIKKYKNGHPELKETILLKNLGLVLKEANYYARVNNMKAEELIGYGYEYLIYALDKFDYTKDYKFSTYASNYIDGGIKRGITELLGYTSGTGQNFYWKLLPYKKAYDELFDEFHENANIVVSEEAKINYILDTMLDENIISKNVKESYKTIIFSACKNGVCFNDYEEDITDYNADVDAIVTDNICKEVIDKLLLTLTPKEEEIIRKYYGLDNTKAHRLKELDKLYNQPSGTINLEKQVAIRKLRDFSRNNYRKKLPLKYR